MFHPVHTYISKFVTNFEARELHVDVFKDGELVYDTPPLEEMRSFVNENLELLWDEYKRSMNPEEYPVDLSEECWNNKMDLIHRVKAEVKEKHSENW